jgi:hypothetical protein
MRHEMPNGTYDQAYRALFSVSGGHQGNTLVSRNFSLFREILSEKTLFHTAQRIRMIWKLGEQFTVNSSVILLSLYNADMTIDRR